MDPRMRGDDSSHTTVKQAKLIYYHNQKMNQIIYKSLYSFFYLISLLPFFLLYGLSDLLYVLVYYIFRYRRQVVSQNLRNAFPNKSEEEIQQIGKKFYRHFCDIIVEVLKLPSISKKEIIRRCQIEPAAISLMNRLYNAKRNFIIVMGHLGNWELVNYAINTQCKNHLNAIYKPLSNTYFDQLINQVRSIWGTKPISMDDIAQEMKLFDKNGQAVGFIADQRAAPENAYWTTFFNQDAAVFRGTEILARRFNYPIVYLGAKREKRGFYRVHIEMLFKDPKLTKAGEISEGHTKRLEQDIIEQPEIWLWSHHRWRNAKPEVERSKQFKNLINAES